MNIAKAVMTGGVVLLVVLFIYILVVTTVSAQNTALWDAFGISFFTSIGPMLLLLIGAIGLLGAALAIVTKLGAGGGEGL
jgi:hypothetical protein